MTQTEVQELRQMQIVTKMIYDLKYCAEVTTFLEVQDFPTAEYRNIYKAILDLVKDGKAVDMMILREKCPDIEIPEKKLLFDEEQVNYQELANRLHSDGNEYRIKVAIEDFLSNSSAEDFKFSEEFEALQKTINQPLAASIGGTVGPELIGKLIERINKGNYESVGRTGISKLDDILGGFEQGLVYTVLAAPGVGKSMLAVQIFHECLEMGVTTMYATNEMSEITVLSRIVARMTNVPSVDIRRNIITDNKFGDVNEAMSVIHDRLAESNSMVYDNAYDVDKLIRAIRFHVMKHGVKTVILDHVHNMHGSGKIFDRISYAAHALQRAARELNISLILLAQMDRASKRSKSIEEKTAKGADDIEEISDVMIFLNRKKIPEGDLHKKENDPKFMQIIVGKNREGKTGQTWTTVSFPSMVIKQDEPEFNF